MNDSLTTARRVWCEITGDPFGDEGQEDCNIVFDSFDPNTGTQVSFIDVLTAWQTITAILVESLEGQPDPENLAGKLTQCFELIFPEKEMGKFTELNEGK